MKLVFLSGGSGKRLWPLSNDSRAKQFLKMLPSPTGELESMVQRVWRQVREAGLANDTYIATNKAQLDILHSQLGGNVSLIIEPECRDTFPAIALAALYLHDVEGVAKDEVIVIQPVDPYTEAHFFERIKDLEAVIERSEAELALIGITPLHPSEKFGYIVPTSGTVPNQDWVNVARFVEKPEESVAQELIESQQALWNGGVFAFRLGYLLQLLEQNNYARNYSEFVALYNQLPKTSFDYAVVEKTKHIVAIPYHGFWKDLGTWNSLTEEMDINILGRGEMSDDSQNTHVINELDIPVTVLGLSNVVVAVGSDGILVTDKDASTRVKEAVKDIVQRPMYEERRWGWYRVLDYTKNESKQEVLTKRIRVHAGKNLSYQLHYKRQEVWTIIQGEGEFALDGRIYRVKTGDVLTIPVGSKHGIKAITDIELVEVQMGTELVEEDIVRIYLEWEEVIKYCNIMV